MKGPDTLPLPVEAPLEMMMSDSLSCDEVRVGEWLWCDV
jgi:hypothetical protein